MKPERLARIEALYHAALEREPADRRAFLDGSDEDREIRKEVADLLALKEKAEQLLEKPAIEVAAGALVDHSWIGQTVGPYEILSLLGTGGMGEVYQGRDPRLERDVALKTLPRAFSSDPNRLARFEREAKLLASLNHPNIATIHGLEEHDGTRFIVLELVEGDTMAEFLAAGPVPVESALKIALQVAEGLEAAHEKGVIHRDLKPANIKITPEGKVKVLDFGLAKAFAGDGSDVNLSKSPTLSMAETEQGVILGTPSYMSPEQARGKEVDRRTDVWAFGCVLFEILAGRKVFSGETLSDTIVQVLEHDPDWDALPGSTPSKILDLIRRCLRKDVQRRLRDIGDARIEIEDVLSAPTLASAPQPVVVTHAGSRPVLRWVIGTAVLTAVVVSIATWNLALRSSNPASAGEVTRLTLDVHEGAHLGARADRPLKRAFALSPGGGDLVYVGNDGEGTQLYLRPLGQDLGVPIPGTEGADVARFSPDGRSIVFFLSSGELMRVPVDGGEARTISATEPRFVPQLGLDWTEDDRILLASAEGVLEVPANGGVVTNLTTHDLGPGYVQAYPQLLPGGAAVLYAEGPVVSGVSSENFKVIVESLETRDRIVVVEGGADPVYLDSGHIAFVRSGTLMAVPFDAVSLEVTGDPVVVLEDVMQAEGVSDARLNVGIGQYSVSGSGTLAYLSGGIVPEDQTQLRWVDLAGNAEPFPLPPGLYQSARFSPDGTRLAYGEGRLGTPRSTWVYDLGLGISTPLPKPSIEHENSTFAWSPDGAEIVFASRIGGDPLNLYLTASDGSGHPARLTESDVTQLPVSWSRNGVLAFLEMGVPGSGQSHIMILQMDEESEPSPFRETPFWEMYPEFSPDGKWLAYTSDETGRLEVHVRPFPFGEPAYQVSNRGYAPAWSPTGEQLFYRVGPNSAVRTMVVDVSREPTFTRSRPRILFEGSYRQGAAVRSYDVSPDGGRFVMATRVNRAPEPATRINIILNWFEELKELVPVP